ncbi:MAG TPA: lipocalin-like domain-containing protein [Waterburya sp.]|jgi:hypothetical protein
MTLQSQFVGSWRLISWENRDDSGNVSYPFGQDAIGYLIYTDDGYMSGTLMKANRPHFAGQDILGGSIEEQARAAQSYIHYCGKYEIQTNKVIHHIEASLFPNWVGINQERFFEFQGNQLSLSTPPLLMNGKQQRGYLIWERTGTPKKSFVAMLCDALKGF